MSMLDSIIDAIERGERALCAFSVALFTLILSANVMLRYLFSSPIYFAEEVCIILLIWMTFLASSLAVGGRQMVAVTLLPEILPHAWRVRFAVAAHLVVLLTSGVFLYWSVVWLLSPSAFRDIIITIGMKKWPAYSIVPAFFALVVLKSVRNLGFVLTNAGDS